MMREVGQTELSIPSTISNSFLRQGPGLNDLCKWVQFEVRGEEDTDHPGSDRYKFEEDTDVAIVLADGGVSS